MSEVKAPFLKNEINVGDRVAVLSYQHILRGEVLKVNQKTYKIRTGNAVLRGETKNFPKEKVAHELDILSVVCDYKKDPNGLSVRFDYTEFPKEAKRVSKWGGAHNFVSIN